MNWMIVAGAFFVALASFLRGLTGFGFAIVATPLLALVLPPAIAVPVATLLQIPSGLPIVFRDWPDTDFRAAVTAWIGGAPALIPGIYLLASAPADLMRLLVGTAVVLSALGLILGIKMNRGPRRIELLGAGALSGLLQGSVAMAGPPIIVLILSSSWNVARCRATLSCVFLLLGTASVIFGTWHGIVTRECLMIALLSLPGLLAGQFLGARLFNRIDGKKYRTISTLCVAAAGVLVIFRGLASYF